MVSNSLILASEVIGFISFSITLATLFGVYAALFKTLRSAPSTIPLTLGNLREEIQYEQAYLQYKLKCGDEFDVFPEQPGYKQRRRRHEFVRLMEETMRHVWREFCDLERDFIVKGEQTWSLQDGISGGDSPDLDEKVSGSRRRRSARGRPLPPRKESFVKNRMGMVEAGLSNDRKTYYSTDLGHRFLWWWKADDIKNLADQIQRLQIRRIERDVYESDELSKRLYRMQCKQYGWNCGRHEDSEDSFSDRDERSGSDDRRGPNRGSAAAATRRRDRRRSRPKTSSAKAVRDVYEREIIRSRRRPEEPTEPRSDHDNRNPRPRRGSIVYEYEVVNPGRIYVETPREEQSRHQARQRSYSRERDS